VGQPSANEDLKKHIRAIEGGFQKKAYEDARGHSIGYGHYIKPGEEHLLEGEITESQAEKMLEEDISSHQKPWIKDLNDTSPEVVKVLTDYAYNAGAWAPELKDAIAAINSGDRQRAADILGAARMHSYSKKTGKSELNPELVTRREWSRRVLSGEKVSWADVKREKTSYFQRAKEFFRTPGKGGVSASTSAGRNDGIMSSNAAVLQGLRELNAENRRMSSEDAWLSKVKQEGNGLGGMGSWEARS